MLIPKTPRIIVQITEGLGNQLFSYATARALSLKNNMPLYLDTYSQFRTNRFKRKYLLDNYYIEGFKISKGLSFFGNIAHLLWKTKILKKKQFNIFYFEQANKLDEELLLFPMLHTTYLLGYWQHEEYFKEYSDQIRKDLQRKTESSKDSKLIAKKIQSVISVCIHIRSYSEIGGENSSPKIYFENAIKYVTEQIQDPYFFIFSDDLEWVDKNFEIKGVFTVVTCNKDKGYVGALDDLWLMSQCKHHILSSSSFSWWGAWLANKEHGIVVAPKNSDLDKSGTFLKRWILL